MRASFHPARRTSSVEKAIEEVRAECEAGHFATVEAALLRPSDVEETRAGTKPLYGLTDERGRRYALKRGRPELMAAEQAAYELRRLGERPCLPCRVIDIELEGEGRVSGLLKPFIEFDVERELQRSVILLEHAWEWLLDNSDTNTSQYALVGERAYPLNIDWDRSFSTEVRSELSRFDKYKAILPNARTFLYSDYVEGKVDLPFSVLYAEARRIRRLPVPAVRRILERYASVRYEDPAEAQSFILRALERQRNIESDFRRFVRELISERLALSVAPETTPSARLRQGVVIAWNHGQHVLQRLSRGPIGSGGRKALRAVRSRLWFGRPRTT
jgi:hypothetical protein